jgi:hypothetical protein
LQDVNAVARRIIAAGSTAARSATFSCNSRVTKLALAAPHDMTAFQFSHEHLPCARILDAESRLKSPRRGQDAAFKAAALARSLAMRRRPV